MKKKIIISGPILSRSGYGEMARFALRSLKRKEEGFDIYILPTNWGNTGNLFDNSVEVKEIQDLITKTQQYIQATNNQPSFDISIQVTIPNEWKKMAHINIGYTAGIETNIISPAWLEPSQQMNKIVVISEHAKNSFINSVFSDNNGKQFRVTTPVEVCHFPVRDYEDINLELELKHDFNFLAVCQWGPRKNLEQTIVNFIEEFRHENVGLVLKVNTANDSLLDKDFTEDRLQRLLENYKDRKCSIHLLHGYLNEAEMQALMKHPKIKCIVSTTHGEGFGFPLFEAAYNELPIVATDWSGHLDFLTVTDDEGIEKKLFGKVDYELKPIAQEHVWQGVLEAGTSWAYPTPNSFKGKMRDVFKDYARYKSWAKKLNKSVRDRFTESSVLNKFLKQSTGEEIITVDLNKLPKISIITSVYKGDEYIKGFLENITEQTVFKDKCELVMVNCNSPENEEAIINEYITKYPENIKYIKLESDPGIYAAWNLAIKNSTGEYITNANLDDRKSPKFMEEMAKALLVNKEIELVYSNNLVTNNPNETWEKNSANVCYPSEEFNLEALLRGNSPHCMPMWKRSLHEKYGYFEESYRSASDWEFWLRSAFGGSKMMKLNSILGLYYFNPRGMSTNQENNSWKRQEEKSVFKKYLNKFQER